MNDERNYFSVYGRSVAIPDNLLDNGQFLHHKSEKHYNEDDSGNTKKCYANVFQMRISILFVNIHLFYVSKRDSALSSELSQERRSKESSRPTLFPS